MIDVHSATDKILGSIDSQIQKYKRLPGEQSEVVNVLMSVRDIVLSIKCQNDQVKKRGWY